MVEAILVLVVVVIIMAAVMRCMPTDAERRASNFVAGPTLSDAVHVCIARRLLDVITSINSCLRVIKKRGVTNNPKKGVSTFTQNN